jgi:C1A family cysteine protease
MKALLVALALVSTGVVVYQNVVSQMGQTNVDDLWTNWKAENNKEYSATEEILRRSIFTANYATILAHNADPTQTFTMKINKFADLTGEEFKEKTRCMDKAANVEADEYCPSAVNCPTLPTTTAKSFDWRSKGAVTPIKNQGDCGSCWAFSTTGSLEGLYKITKNILLSFSEQQLVDCAKSCYGCDGCWPYVAMIYANRTGMALEKLYPYKGYEQSCRIPNNVKLIRANTGAYQCVEQKSLPQVLSATVQQPVSIAVEADQSAWQFYGGGIVTKSCGDRLDHAVLIVGFDITSSDPSKQSFTVKNSWGADWGENGYIRIGTSTTANTGYGVCGILRCATLPINEK